MLLAPLATAPVAEVLAGLEPADPDYRRLVAEKRRLEEQARTASWGPAVAGRPDAASRATASRGSPSCAPGSPASATCAPGGETVDPSFDAGLEAAVKTFQADHGLVDDGVVGKATLAAVNAPVETRLAQVAVNLERMRWMPRDLGDALPLRQHPRLHRDARRGRQRRSGSSKVVVGKAQVTETAEFSDEMTYMVVNPTWHIPDSIAIRDYLPKLQRDPMVLKRQNIRPADPRRHRDQPEARRLHPVHARELPVPHQAAAERRQRARQGEVHVPEPASRSTCTTRRTRSISRATCGPTRTAASASRSRDELAHILLTGQVPDPAAAFDGWVAARSERTVDLDRSIPIHIVYRTVFFDEGGTLRFRPDVYGRDARAFEALEAAGVTLPAAQG